MGSLQAEEPILGKEGVGPAMMVVTPGDAPSSAVVAQQASQPAAYPSVESAERGAVAVQEVGEPAAQHWVEAFDDRPQALPCGPPCLGTNDISQLPQPLLPR